MLVEMDAVDVLDGVEDLGLGEQRARLGLLVRVGELDLAEAMAD